MLELNISKSQIILFRKGGQGYKKRLTPIEYNNMEIEFVKEYSFLGVTFVQSGTYDNACKKFLIKGKNAIQPSVNLLNKVNKFKTITCQKLFEASISSTVLYAAPT